jgi:DNA mismatch endonuclease, patch repair protein
MSRVRGKHTSPEVRVRKAAHQMGLRFRLHRKDLPGKPDLVFPKHKVALFVHGCFWHRHPGCKKATTPKTRVDYWIAKFAVNERRDKQNIRDLAALGWNVHIIWECETKDLDKLPDLIGRCIRNG